MNAFALATLLVALGPGGLAVRGTTECPAPDDVARRLRPLLPAASDLPSGAWLEIAAPPADGTANAGEIEVRLQAGAPPRVLGVRRLAASNDCDGAAQAVAVVAATWTANYRSPLPAPAMRLAPPPFAAPRPAQETDGETPSAKAGVAGAVRATPAAAPATLALDVSAGAGLVTATAGTSAPFLLAELGLRGRSRLAARVVAMAVGERTIALGSGQAAWRRLSAGAGVAYLWGTRAAYLQIGGDAWAGAAFIEGRGFAENARSTSFDAGAGPWLRAGAQLAAAPVTVWVGAEGLVWAREQRVHVDPVVSRDALPRLDLLVGAGVTWTPRDANRNPR